MGSTFYCPPGYFTWSYTHSCQYSLNIFFNVTRFLDIIEEHVRTADLQLCNFQSSSRSDPECHYLQPSFHSARLSFLDQDPGHRYSETGSRLTE